jgi:YHS domain-containing protein
MKVKDPVCNMDVDSEKASAKFAYKGVTYYFCAPGCSKAFQANPEKYLGEAQAAPAHQHGHGHHHGEGHCC